MTNVHILNKTMELEECRNEWTYNEREHCYCLEDLVYTPIPRAAKFQRLSIFVPEAYKGYIFGEYEDETELKCGNYTAWNAPVVFENNASGYSEMEHEVLGGNRIYAEQYLSRGMVYITCGCRGRETCGEDGKWIGKAPATLVDFKTAIRFLRHNRKAIPGDMDKIISVGWSAGGAMSALIGCTGNSPLFDDLLRENGAFMEETDDVFAAQVYCPIIDLEHADQAYEWQYHRDPVSMASPFSPGGPLTDYQKALSEKMYHQYIEYFNSLGVKGIKCGQVLTLGVDGRSGTAYQELMAHLNDAATVYLKKLENGELSTGYGVEEYLDGNYTYEVPDMDFLMRAIAEQMAAKEEESKRSGEVDETSEEGNFEGFGMRMELPKIPMLTKQGVNKRSFLLWDGTEAKITSLDDFVTKLRRRMKSCPSFDFLDASCGENQLFGDQDRDFMHFNSMTGEAIEALKDAFPEEYARYYESYEAVKEDEALTQRKYLINPYSYIGTGEKCEIAPYFRINVGADDADTSFMVSMVLACKLNELADVDVQYHLYWEQPHSEADDPGEVCEWIERIVAV